MPEVVGPRRMPNHAVVAGSWRTSARPPRRNCSTSASFPRFASSRTNSATHLLSEPCVHLLDDILALKNSLVVFEGSTMNADNMVTRKAILRRRFTQSHYCRRV